MKRDPALRAVGTVGAGRDVTWCLTNICNAGDLAKFARLRELEGSKNLAVEVVDITLLAVIISLPLDRFPAVSKAVPTQPLRAEDRRVR